MATTTRAPWTGDVLDGKYVLRERLGEGGMGLVFRADQPALGRSVAIKVLHPRLAASEWIARRFSLEAIAASRVRHPGAVSVIEHGLAGDTPYIVMEHVRGIPLGRLIAARDVPVPRALAIVDQILEVLEAAHGAGVVHADIKCDNVLVEQRADRDVVTVIDFGLARVDDAWSELEPGSTTPGYLAPELGRGEPPTPASDVYGVAVILYELLTGAMRTCELPAGLDAIVLRALSEEPGARFADARQLQLALRRAASAEAGARDPAAAERTQPRLPRRAGRAGLARGSALRPPGGPGEARRAIAQALIAGNVGAIARGYVALAEALVRHERPIEAIRELEEGIDVLTAGSADHAREGHLLVVALATLSRRVARARR